MIAKLKLSSNHSTVEHLTRGITGNLARMAFITRQLGRDGPQVAAVGFGAMGLGGKLL
jgi:hypothetical protein